MLWQCFKKGIVIELSQKYNSNVYYVRNDCLGAHNLAGIHQKPWQGLVEYDYIMWIDSDIVFAPEQVFRLINIAEQHKQVQILSGLYMMGDEINYATVLDWDVERFKLDGRFEFLTRSKLQTMDADRLFTVSYTGFGFMLIRNGVFESLEYPWFRPHWEDVEMPNGILVHDFTSEDVGFCRSATRGGYQIYIDPTTIVGHEKPKVLY